MKLFVVASGVSAGDAGRPPRPWCRVVRISDDVKEEAIGAGAYRKEGGALVAFQPEVGTVLEGFVEFQPSRPVQDRDGNAVMVRDEATGEMKQRMSTPWHRIYVV